MKRFHLSLICFCGVSLASLAFGQRNRAQPGQLAALTASDGSVGSQLGESVAISGDAVFATNSLPLDIGGSAYVWVKPPAGWTDMTETAKLTLPPYALTIDSIAASGNTVVASVSGAGPNGNGALFVFVKPQGGWTNMTPTAVLSPVSGKVFGINVAINGDTIVAGDTGCHGANGPSAGTAYVFREPADGWHDMHETARLISTDSQTCDDFGDSVAVLGNTIVVGADWLGQMPPDSPGKAYVYVKPAGGWTNMTQTAELAEASGFPGDGFGGQVAVGNGTVISTGKTHQGTPGIFVFEKPVAGWADATQNAILSGIGLGPIAINHSGNTVASGTPAAFLFADGVVRVFTEPIGGWLNASKATYHFPGTSDDPKLGQSVSIEGFTVAAGAPAAYDSHGNFQAGAVILLGK